MWQMLNALPLSNHIKATALIVLISLVLTGFLSGLDRLFYPKVSFWTHYWGNLKVTFAVDIMMLFVSFALAWVISNITFN
ncbi:hypothetical protein D7C21_14945 [Salmonella enterica]|nr:hypothetical protein [Salmonella enterica]EBI9231596.1 hypothetical protein [Salmonella enterica]